MAKYNIYKQPYHQKGNGNHNNNNNIEYISTPYYFVPLNKRVFEWKKSISQDVPFKEGISGSFDISIEAHTPIFIRDANEKSQFCNQDGHYFIPGTSIKGMVRSVLEIFSFSKLKLINNRRYAIRDLNSPVYELKEDLNNIRCGWLSKKEAKNGEINYSILDCEIPWRISYGELRNAGLNNILKNEKNQYIINNSLKNLSGNKFITTEIEGDKELAKVDKRIFCKVSHNGGRAGTIVFTGKAVGKKKYEFVFTEPESEQYIPIPENVWNDTKINYYDSDLGEHKISKEWEWRKKQLDNGKRIPVFFRTKEDKHGNKLIKDFGLSYLYKMTYEHTTKDCLPNTHTKNIIDMAEAIFGYSEKETSLKGRVQFSHAWGDLDTITALKIPFHTILGTPRASFYPTYIVQNGDGQKVEIQDNKYIYNTYQNSDPELSGRKRYILKDINNEELEYNENIHKITKSSTGLFYPLVGKNDKAPTFKTKIRFHNLLPEELGALISAITLHNSKEHFHGLGMCKPHGLGCVSLNISALNILYSKEKYKEYTPEDFMVKFEQLMNEELKEEWIKTKEIKEFCACSLRYENHDSLNYMPVKDFSLVKKNGLYLKSRGEINRENHIPNKPFKTLIIKDKNNNKSVLNTCVGEKYIATVLSAKKVSIYGNDRFIETQLVLNKTQKANPPKAEETIEVAVKQTKKDGSISQVELVTN
jgi:CRISPR-associated protein (TIGR03986 family)